MKAMTFDRTGGPEVLRITEVPTPEPRPGQVLIRTAYAGINFADIGRRSGLYGLGPLPAIPGLEGSGTVEAVGEGVSGLKPGMEVLGYAARGTYAEYFIARDEKVAPVPAGMSLAEAAGIAQIFMTSWNALVHKAKLQAGESILVQSAGNGAGIAAVQIAKHLGARVIGTASSAAKLQAAAESGADDRINYVEQDFEAEVQHLTGGRGVDVVLDGVGGETFTRSVRCLAQGGRMLSLGYSGGDSALTVPAFELNRGIVVMGGAAGFTELPRSELEKVLGLLEAGSLKPVHTEVFPWTDAGEAQRSIEERRAVGKVVLQVA
jgi:NADPH2:quinone reductase